MATTRGRRVRLTRIAATLILAAVSVGAQGTSAFAAGVGTVPSTAGTATVKLLTGEVVPTDPTKRSSTQETAYRNQIANLEAQGKLTPSMMTQMGLRLLTPPSGAVSATHELSAPATAPSSDVSPMACGIDNAQTSGTAMSLPTPTITLNGSSQGYIMYANASYRWASPLSAPSTCVMAVGGVDGFAVALDQPVINLGVSFSACNANNLCGSSGYLQTNSQYGAGWAFQDYAASQLSGWGSTYSGTLTYAFRFQGGIGCIQAFSKYAHDWNSTSVNGFSIGPWSIGVSWSSSSSLWDKSSQGGKYSC